MDKAQREAAIRAARAAESARRNQAAIERNHAVARHAHKVWSATGKANARLPFGKRK